MSIASALSVRYWLFLVTMLLSAHSLAQQPAPAIPPGTGIVVNLSGLLTAKKADGSVRVLSMNSQVTTGDTLYTGAEAFSRVKFADGSLITLRPNTEFKVESFNFEETKPEADSSVFKLVKGGLRSITGLLGKRSKAAYRMETETATIGIRGTHFGIVFCQSDCAGITTPSGQPLENGLHIEVTEGAVAVTNPAGTVQLNAGQSGFVAGRNVLPVARPAEQGLNECK